MKKIIVLCLLLFPFSSISSGFSNEKCRDYAELIIINEAKLTESYTDISSTYFLGKIKILMEIGQQLGCAEPPNDKENKPFLTK